VCCVPGWCAGLATLLLQRLEAKLLGTPEPFEHPEHPVAYPGDPTMPLTYGRAADPPAASRRTARVPV
jgi:hypothetical protein